MRRSSSELFSWCVRIRFMKNLKKFLIRRGFACVAVVISYRYFNFRIFRTDIQGVFLVIMWVMRKRIECPIILVGQRKSVYIFTSFLKMWNSWMISKLTCFNLTIWIKFSHFVLKIAKILPDFYRISSNAIVLYIVRDAKQLFASIIFAMS